MAGWADEVRAFAEQARTEAQVPGLALGVALGGTPVFLEGFGQRHIVTDQPVTPDTIFGGASTTKSLTCMAILQLEEAGKLAVTDPVTRYLPEFRLPNGAEAGVTLHHFMTHSAGLPPLPTRYWASKRRMAADNAPETPPAWVQDHAPVESYEELMAFIADYGNEGRYRLFGPPGTHFSYSNEGFALLGAVIERVSGEAYPEYVQAHILDPAGMTRSTVSLDRLATFPDVTTLHAARTEAGEKTVFASPLFYDVPIWAAAGGLNTTVRDFLRYLEIFRTGGTVAGTRILAPESVAKMTTPHIPTNAPGNAYGYGLSIATTIPGMTVIAHGGGRKGISAHIMLVPEIGFTATALSNLAEFTIAASLLAALSGVRGLPVSGQAPLPSETSPAPDAGVLAAYAGRYRSDEGAQVAVSLVGARLEIEIGGRTLPMRTAGPHGFLAGEQYHRFLIDDAGAAYGIAVGARIVPRLDGPPAASSNRI